MIQVTGYPHKRTDGLHILQNLALGPSGSFGTVERQSEVLLRQEKIERCFLNVWFSGSFTDQILDVSV